MLHSSNSSKVKRERETDRDRDRERMYGRRNADNECMLVDVVLIRAFVLVLMAHMMHSRFITKGLFGNHSSRRRNVLATDTLCVLY